MYTQSHPGPERPTQDKYDRFEAWLRENGAQFDMVGFIPLYARGENKLSEVLLSQTRLH